MRTDKCSVGSVRSSFGMQLYLNSVDYMYQLYITYHNKHLVKQEQRGAPGRGAQSGSRIYQFVGGGGFAEFDVEFKFAKIQNSHLWEGGGLVEPISNF